MPSFFCLKLAYNYSKKIIQTPLTQYYRSRYTLLSYVEVKTRPLNFATSNQYSGSGGRSGGRSPTSPANSKVRAIELELDKQMRYANFFIVSRAKLRKTYMHALFVF